MVICFSSQLAVSLNIMVGRIHGKNLKLIAFGLAKLHWIEGLNLHTSQSIDVRTSTVFPN